MRNFQIDPDSILDRNIVGIFFEGIGVLLHRKLINIDLVSDLLGSQVRITWEIMRQTVETSRKGRQHCGSGLNTSTMK
jgi:hypothetical protein